MFQPILLRNERFLDPDNFIALDGEGSGWALGLNLHGTISVW